MKKEKTGREVLGTRLFADPAALGRSLQSLRSDADLFLREARAGHPDEDPEQFRSGLHAAFGLRPLKIDDVLSIKIEVPRRDYQNEYAAWMSGHLAEAVVPYSGSAVFWRAPPRPDFEFGLPGRVGPFAARLRMFLDEKAFDTFEALVERELAAARKALNNRAGEVALLSLRVTEILNEAADACSKAAH